MENGGICETEHDFALALASPLELNQQIEDTLYEAGCDDATLSLRAGRLFLNFTRMGSTLADAITTAIRDVRKANVGAQILRVDACQLVTQAEIARRIGRTRQLISQYASGDRGPGGFPGPVCYITDSSPLWYWCEVAHWLHRHNMISTSEWQETQATAIINAILELENLKQLNPGMADEMMRSLCGERVRVQA